MNFYKIHGAGNDFVFLDGREQVPRNLEQLAQKLCDRHLGVGADGLIILLPSVKADVEMHYRNADGSVTTCGNGARCLARFCEFLGLWRQEKPTLSIDTAGGVVMVERSERKGTYTVNMGSPRFEPSQIPVALEGEPLRRKLTALGSEYTFSAVSMGNPHCVIFVDSISAVPFHELGAAIEKHELFPQKTNVEFVEVHSRSRVKVRVWERGVGPTLACGTANCAVLAVGVREGRLDKKITLEADGGEFLVELRGQQFGVECGDERGEIFLTGPTALVFKGEILG